MSVVIEGRALTQDYVVSGGMFTGTKTVRAVKGVDFTVEKGKTLAIVGESGSGKSTLSRIIALIDAPSSGELRIAGEVVDIARQRPRQAAPVSCISFSFQRLSFKCCHEDRI